MNASISTLVLLLLHLLVCLVLWLLIRCGILDIKGYFFPVILLVPIWGPLCVLILHTNRALFGDDLLEKTLKKMHINEEIHRSILVPGNADEEQVIPLEEALLVNNPLQKRQLILSVLTEAPTSYYHLLQQARLNNDSEVVHYASTALAQFPRKLISHCNSMNSNMLLTGRPISCAVTAIIWKATSNPGMCRAVRPRSSSASWSGC